MTKLSLIVATEKNWGIGIKNNLPWSIKEDLIYFQNITTKTIDKHKTNAIVMGKNTFNSIGKVLPNRYNFVVTKDSTKYTSPSLYDITKVNWIPFNRIFENYNNIETMFIIGGTQLYKSVLDHGLPDDSSVYLNTINKSYDCDVYFPYKSLQKQNFVIVDTYTLLVNSENGEIEIKRNILKKEDPLKNEYQYLNMLNEIITTGDKRQTRNAVTYSIFDTKLVFDVSERFPLLTTKKMFTKGIIEELLFFLKGNTDSKHLEEKGVNIWKGNTTREFLDARGLSKYKEGDIGPMYGYSWRFFGADYKGCDHNYSGEGFDQLKDVIAKIQNDPTNRRIMMTTFDPSKVSESVLAPCHSLILQFYIHDDKISCKMYQR